MLTLSGFVIYSTLQFLVWNVAASQRIPLEFIKLQLLGSAMTETIALNCLIKGSIPSKHVFTIDIEKNKTVSQLKTKIRDSNPERLGSVDLEDITLWKINISPKPTSNSDHDISKLAILEKGTDIDIAQELDGVEILSIENISEVFPTELSNKYVHVLVEWSSGYGYDLSKAESLEKKLDQILQNTEIIMDSLENLHAKVNSLQRIVFQLHEDTVPRLFIILPEAGAWDFTADALFTRSYRLYFLCEHKEVLPNGKEVCQVHLAKHDGYKLRQPRQFMEKYGAYILQIMPYLKIAIHVAQNSLELMPFVGNTASKLLDEVGDAALSATDYPILKGKEKMHLKALEMCAGAEELLRANNYQPAGRLGSVGRPDLRALQAYLHGIDTQNSFGRLQRVLSKNDVLWVCEAHATTCYTNDDIKEIQRIISSSSMDEKVFLDTENYALRIDGLDRNSLASLSRQLKPHLKHIAVLEISFKNVIESGISLLDVNFQNLLDSAPTVRIVRFENCTFQSNMLKSRTLYYLQELYLENVNISSSGARSLASFLEQAKALIKLYLRANGIERNEAIILANSLKKNSTLARLDLTFNNIGNDGAIALADTLTQNTTLTQLNLESNAIEEDGAIALGNALRQNSTLTLLNLGLNSIGVNGIMALADTLKQNSTLAQLNIWYNKIGVDGAIVLTEALKQNATLTHLDLSSNNIEGNGAMAVADALKQNSTLTQLNIGYNNIGEKGAIVLINSLKRNFTLTHLELSSNNIAGNGAMVLADVLKQNSTLTQLNIKYNNIGDNGTTKLANALKHNSTLTQLDLGTNAIGDNGAMALADTLRQNTTLTQLILTSNAITTDGVIALADALKQNLTLTQLILRYNKINDNGAIALANALKQNSTLTQLNLRENNITPEGKRAFDSVGCQDLELII